MTEKKTVIISGGAGYIGSCTAYLLQVSGYEPIIFDNFSTSQKPSKPQWPVFEIDLTDLKALSLLMSKVPKIHAMFHFAAKALVPESTEYPWNYFHNNINATLNLCEMAQRFSISNFIHSSTCAVYGMPQSIPMREDDTLNPVTPYGHSKLAAEKILDQYSTWKNLRVMNLRYFNPAGAFPEAFLGETHDPETHLVPNLVKSFMNQAAFEIYGNDYPTPDGTCIRDLIHIRDLAKAHLLGLRYLESHPKVKFETLNIGSGMGTSVKQAVAAAEKVLGIKGDILIKPRRPGDPPQLIADNSKMKHLLNWSPEHSLEAMIKDHADFIRLKST